MHCIFFFPSSHTGAKKTHKSSISFLTILLCRLPAETQSSPELADCRIKDVQTWSWKMKGHALASSVCHGLKDENGLNTAGESSSDAKRVQDSEPRGL